MKINFIRMMLAIAALRNLEVHHMDVKTVFLNGELNEKNLYGGILRASLLRNKKQKSINW